MAIYSTAADLYNAVLRELDKFKSPSFTFYDFNYWMAKGLQQYLNKRYELFDTKQQTIDDLRAIIPDLMSGPSTIPIGSTRIGTLPADYFHLIGGIANMRYTAPYKCNAAGTTYAEPIYRMTSDLLGFTMIDHYTKPAPDFVYYKINKNQIRIIFDDPNYPVNYLQCDSIQMEYIQVPSQIQLLTNPASITTNTALNTTNCQFPDYVWMEIVNQVALLFLEDVEQRRVQTHPVVNKSIT